MINDQYFRDLETFETKYENATRFRVVVHLEDKTEVTSTLLPLEQFDDMTALLATLEPMDTFFLWSSEENATLPQSGYIHAIPVRRIMRTAIILYR